MGHQPALLVVRLLALLVLGVTGLLSGCGKQPSAHVDAGAVGRPEPVAALPDAATAADLAEVASAVALPNAVTPGVAGVLRKRLPFAADAAPAAIVPWGDSWMIAWCEGGSARRALVSNAASYPLPVEDGTSCEQRLVAGGKFVWWLGAVGGKPTLTRAALAAGTPRFEAVGLPDGLTITAQSQLRVDGEGRAWWALGKPGANDVLGTAGNAEAKSVSRDAEGTLVAIGAMGAGEGLSVLVRPRADGSAMAQITRWKPDLQPVWQRPWEIGKLRRLGKALSLAATAEQEFSGRGAGVGLLLETDSDWQLAQLDTNGQVNLEARVSRTRDVAMLHGMPDGSWVVVQSRTGGMWMQRLPWRESKVERALRFGWLGDEQVLAAGHNAHVLSFLSRDDTSSALLLSALESARLSDIAPRAPPKHPQDCRDAEPCDMEAEFGEGRCGSWPLSDGQACGNDLVCRSGFCRAP